MLKAPPITSRLDPPTPQEVQAGRLKAGLTQAQAAALVSASTIKSYRTWQNYEAAADSSEHREIPLACWELFLLLTEQHPAYRLRAHGGTRT